MLPNLSENLSKSPKELKMHFFFLIKQPYGAPPSLWLVSAIVKGFKPGLSIICQEMDTRSNVHSTRSFEGLVFQEYF